jgi:hypothetical protein
MFFNLIFEGRYIAVSKDPIKALKGRYKKSGLLKALLKARQEERNACKRTKL